MNQNEKKLNDFTTNELLEQLLESMEVGLENIEKDTKTNVKLQKVLSKQKDPVLDKLKTDVDSTIEQLIKAKTKMETHKQYIIEVVEEIKSDESKADLVNKILTVFLRK